MASHVPYMAFLRPLALPRPATVQRLLRYSTKPRHDASPREDRNLVASRKADPAYPPSSMRSNPRPLESRASRRTSHPPKQRHYPTRTAQHNQPAPQPLIPASVVPLSAEMCAPNLPYFVNRTKSNELPVYHLFKAGGNKLLTQIRKIDGDVEILRAALQTALKLNRSEANINPVTKHIIIKGHHKLSVRQYLWERKF